jgi:hypothetical protein
MHLYLATDLTPVEGYQGPDEDEHLEVQRLPWRQAVAMAGAGEIEDAKTIIGLLQLGRLAAEGEIDGS